MADYTRAIDDVLTFYANSHSVSTGGQTDDDGSPSYRVYEDETGTAILTGTMAKLDDASTTGFYSEQITLSAANGFEANKTYAIRKVCTVDGVAGVQIDTLSIVASLSVDASGNVTVGGFSTTAKALIQTEVQEGIVAEDVATGAEVETVGNNVITTLADTNELQTDLTNGGRLDLLIDAIKAKTDNLPSDPADESLIIAATDALATLITTVDTVVDAIKLKTDNLPSDPADASVVAGLIAAAEAKVDIVDTVVDAIKLKTDNLPSDPADESLVIAATDAIFARLGAPVGASTAADIASVMTRLGSPAGASVSADVAALLTAVQGYDAYKKNVAVSVFAFFMADTNGDPLTGATVSCFISKDGATSFSATATPTATEMASGWYKIALTQTEMNADEIAFLATATGAKPRNIKIRTQS